MASWERGRPARTKPGTASAISPTWINRERRQGSPSAWPLRFPPTGWLPAASHWSSAAAKGTGCGRDARAPRRCRPSGAVGGIWRATSQKADVHPLGNSRLPASPAPAPHDGADHTRVKQPVLIPIGSRGHVSLIRLAASLNINTQDRQDKQDEKLLHKKLIGSIIECAFVENLSVLRGPSRIPFESFPTPWNPFADSSFALLTDPLSPLVEIFSPFPTFGGSLLSFLQPLSGPSSSFVALRGYLFSFIACRSEASPR